MTFYIGKCKAGEAGYGLVGYAVMSSLPASPNLKFQNQYWIKTLSNACLLISNTDPDSGCDSGRPDGTQ